MALDDYILDIPMSPGAGSDVSFVIPAGVWRIIGGHFDLTTSATVAVRTFSFLIHSVAQFANHFGFFYNPSTVTQAASLAQKYILARGMVNSAALLTGSIGGFNPVLVGLPTDLLISGGDTVQSFTNNLQAGDIYNSALLRIEKIWRP